MNKLDPELVHLCLGFLHPAQRSITRLVCKKWITPVEKADIALYIAREGYKDLMNYLRELGYEISRIERLAAFYGNLELISNPNEDHLLQTIMGGQEKALSELVDKVMVTSRSLGIAAERGSLKALQEVYRRVPGKIIDRTTTWEKYSWALSIRQLPTMESFHYYCDTEVEIVRDMVERFQIQDLRFIIEFVKKALSRNKLDITEYLLSLVTLSVIHQRILYSCVYSEEAIEFLWARFPIPELVIGGCIRADSIRLLERFRGESSDIVAPWPQRERRSLPSRLSTLQWLFSSERLHGPMPWYAGIVSDLISAGNLEAIRWVIEQPQASIDDVFYIAICKGKIEIVELLLPKEPSPYNADEYDRIERPILICLIKHRLITGDVSSFFRKAIRKLDWELLELLYENFPSSWKSSLYYCAAVCDNIEVLNWIYNKERSCPLPDITSWRTSLPPRVVRWFKDRGML